LGDILAIEDYSSGRGLLKADDQPTSCRLAAPAFTNKPQGFTGEYAKVYAVDSLYSANLPLHHNTAAHGEMLRQIHYFEQHVCHGNDTSALPERVARKHFA